MGYEQLGAAEAFAKTLSAPDFVLAAWWGLAEQELLAGEHEQAIVRTGMALELAIQRGERARLAPIVVTGVRARIAAGQPADAERWFAEAAAFLDGHDRSAALDHAAGLLALAAGSLAAARASLERSVRGWDARGRAWEGMWARLDLAGCMLRLARGTEGSRLIADVRATAERLGSPPVLARVEELERLNRSHGAEEPAWHPLTVREYEVARLIASGLTNGEIAGELSVSPRTVSAHVEHILAKLGAARRTEIASWVATTVHPAGTQEHAVSLLSRVPAGAVSSPSDR